MKYIELLKSLLGLLKLGDYDIAHEALLAKAAAWSLNSNSFPISEYKAVALKPILATLNGKATSQFRVAEKLSVNITMPTNEKPEILEHFKTFKTALQSSSDENLLTTLEIYGSTLAVSTQYDDISLFDFIKTTIGIASCLQNNNDKLRLAGGSISGIQTYLYEIISKNAAKLLKGRSFYIQLLVDSVLNELIQSFNLSPAHIVYSSGGGFYIFMPDSLTIEEEFKIFSNQISQAVYKKHKIALYIDLAITETFDANKKVNLVRDELFTALENLKYKRLNNNDALLTAFFEKVELGGTRDKDPITNEEFEDGAETDTLLDGTKVLRSTKQQINLGKELRNADYWISSKSKILGVETIEDPFGTFHYLKKERPKNVSSANIWAINETKDDSPFVFYGGNKFPTHPNGDIKSFDELAENADFARIAILRMDVDGLGSIFSDETKLKSTHYALNWVRYVAVSRSLDQFFKGYLNHLQTEVETQMNATEKSIIIYSGGDDLFLIGRWDTTLALAQAIYKKFNHWTGGVLTISGGSEMLPIKFPIMQGAKMTAVAEDKAKNHKLKIGTAEIEKNAITILGKPLNWEYEFSTVNELQEKLYVFLFAKKLEKSILGKINLHADAQTSFYENKTNSPKWMWIMAYDFARVKERLKDKDVIDFIEELKIASMTNQFKGKRIISKYPFLQLLQLAARWAELRYRSNNKINLLNGTEKVAEPRG